MSAALAMALAAAHPLVHLNAVLNSLATALLVVGLWRIKHRREAAHGRTMLAALAVSTAFLTSYLAYHYLAGSVRFTHAGPARYVYLAILASHFVLAATVPLLAGITLYRAWRRDFEKHRRIARWTWPIWMYVSVTGVAIYVMLYEL